MFNSGMTNSDFTKSVCAWWLIAKHLADWKTVTSQGQHLVYIQTMRLADDATHFDIP